MLIPVFTVAENIMLGDETVRNGILDRRTVSERVRELSHRYGLDIDPDVLVSNLPVGVQQRVAGALPRRPGDGCAGGAGPRAGPLFAQS